MTITAKTLCPSWCTQAPGEHECTTEHGLPVHYGPNFDERVGIQGVDGQRLEAIVWVGQESAIVNDSDELRRVATALIEAADWMEANS